DLLDAVKAGIVAMVSVAGQTGKVKE
ncbi:hypothetical protein LCGC14_3077110, partial [marine sediment metagenome]